MDCRFPHVPCWPLLALGALFAHAQVATAQPARPAVPIPLEKVDPALVAHVVKTLLVDEIEPQYEEWDNWNKQANIFDGLKLKGKGLKISLRKKEKRVNHGLWKHFVVTVRDPKQDVRVTIQNVRKVDHLHVRFDLIVQVRAQTHADLQQWSNGLKLLAVSGDADVDIKLTLDCEVGIWLEKNRFFPDIVVDPKVHRSDLDLTSFRLRRFGDLIKGDVAREVGNGGKRAVERAVRKQEDRVTKQVNKAFAKLEQKGKLRFSPTDEITGALRLP